MQWISVMENAQLTDVLDLAQKAVLCVDMQDMTSIYPSFLLFNLRLYVYMPKLKKYCIIIPIIDDPSLSIYHNNRQNLESLHALLFVMRDCHFWFYSNCYICDSFFISAGASVHVPAWPFTIWRVDPAVHASFHAGNAPDLLNETNRIASAVGLIICLVQKETQLHVLSYVQWGSIQVHNVKINISFRSVYWLRWLICSQSSITFLAAMLGQPRMTSSSWVFAFYRRAVCFLVSSSHHRGLQFQSKQAMTVVHTVPQTVCRCPTFKTSIEK